MNDQPSIGVEAAGPGVAGTAAAAKRILAEVERAVVGKRHVLELVLAGLLADGHVLLDDLPGVAKTLLARSFATVAGLEFRRLQLTPDVLPADITGTMVLDLATTTPVFRPGPVFAQLVLADEINRAPAKTQAALLEAMQERQVTMDGNTHLLPRPFLTIATQNPIESEGTYPLPEAQLDRFLLRTGVGYPTPDDELELLTQRITRGQDDVPLTPVVTAEQFRTMQASLEQVHVDRSIAQYAVALVTATRSDKQLEVGSSPRGSLALIKLSRAIAVLAGRDFTTPDDMRAIAVPALAHRVVLRSEAWARRVSSDDVVRQIVDRVPAPNWR
ncbi:ATPase [Actinocatenispora thailandica]|uniref:ATPase n=1 Tax=Actinocatenispora thailandica TaxID=227318 RepID=A0A7R7DRE9_9ACTN|nr:MoxR family ATPase [Actinocatenispora thailandica]BCJ36434.1 ATPase [Actinocatenispora thailandica]